jgi:hypothetical protein
MMFKTLPKIVYLKHFSGRKKYQMKYGRNEDNLET